MSSAAASGEAADAVEDTAAAYGRDAPPDIPRARHSDLEDRVDDVAGPFALEQLGLDEQGFATHPELLHDPDRPGVPRIGLRHDAMETQLLEPDPEELRWRPRWPGRDPGSPGAGSSRPRPGGSRSSSRGASTRRSSDRTPGPPPRAGSRPPRPRCASAGHAARAGRAPRRGSSGPTAGSDTRRRGRTGHAPPGGRSSRTGGGSAGRSGSGPPDRASRSSRTGVGREAEVVDAHRVVVGREDQERRRGLRGQGSGVLRRFSRLGRRRLIRPRCCACNECSAPTRRPWLPVRPLPVDHVRGRHVGSAPLRGQIDGDSALSAPFRSLSGAEATASGHPWSTARGQWHR